MRYLIAIVSLITLGFSAQTALGVGSGGGGGSPACSEDTYNCTEWSQCAADGKQTRTCTLVFDCNLLDTPKPAELQSCTPPPPPTPEQPATEPAPAVTTTTTQPPAPPTEEAAITAETPTVPPKPACTQDVWTCDAWSKTCDKYGNHNRKCTVATDCPEVATPAPDTKKRCEQLQCGGLAMLKERVSCRLNLAPAGIQRELEIQYLPEQCRPLEGNERQTCVKLYRDLQPCFDQQYPSLRFACAAKILAFGQSVSAEAKKCNEQPMAERSTCKQTLREKAFNMIKFRFYDLSERAETLGARGAISTADVADFVTLVETKKMEFDGAADNPARSRIILDIREAWKTLLLKLKK